MAKRLDIWGIGQNRMKEINRIVDTLLKTAQKKKQIKPKRPKLSPSPLEVGKSN